MVLIAEDRNRQIDGRRRAIFARLGLGVFDCPARVAILLAELRGLVFPVVGDAPVLDRLLLVLGVALTRSGDQARIDDLARHGDVPGLPKRCIEALEQWPDGAGLREFLPEQNDENFEHHHRIKWRAPALRPVRIGERCVQFRAKRLEFHRSLECLELVTEIAQPLQSIIDIENPACLRIESSPIHPSQWNQKSSELARFLEASGWRALPGWSWRVVVSTTPATKR